MLEPFRELLKSKSLLNKVMSWDSNQQELCFMAKNKYAQLPERDSPIMITIEKQNLLQIGRNKE